MFSISSFVRSSKATIIVTRMSVDVDLTVVVMQLREKGQQGAIEGRGNSTEEAIK